jgi:hypothetical protein
MKTYAISEPWTESGIRKLYKVRQWVIGISVPIFLIAFYLWLHTIGRHAEYYHGLLFALMMGMIGVWTSSFRPSAHKDIAERSRIHSIEIDTDGLRLNFLTSSKFLPWNEITQIQEAPNGRGMYLRTHARFWWYLIPRKTDHYEEIKSGLAATGIPIVETSRPWDWSIPFVILGCASLLCTLLIQNQTILTINFAVALALGIAGIFYAKRIGDRRLKLLTAAGSFMPALFAAISLISPIGIK